MEFFVYGLSRRMTGSFLDGDRVEMHGEGVLDLCGISLWFDIGFDSA